MKNLIQHKIFGLKWPTILLGILFLLLKQEMQAQVISNNGVYVSIAGGTVVNIDSIINDNATTLSNEGTINISTINNAGTTQGNGTYNIAGNFTNPGTFISNNSTVNMNGILAQTLPGSIFFNNLIINNAAGVTMAGNITVGSTLNLNTGNLKIGANTLTLNGSAIRVSGNLEGSHTSSLTIAGTAGSLFFDQLSTNNFLKNLTINAGATATLGNDLNITAYDGISSEGALTIIGSGALTTGGFLTIKSNEFGTARISKGTGNSYISGSVTVERYISTGNGNRAWRLLSVPTTGQTIKASWQENQPAGVVGVTGFGTQITSPQSNAISLGFDAVTPGASMYRYDSSSNILRAIINTKDSLIADYQGYFLYIRGDRRQGVSSSTTTLNATTLRTKGALLLGLSSTPVVANKSALVGNPYPSAIDLTTGGITYTGSVGATTFRVWDPKLNTLGGYQTLTKNVSGDYQVSPGNGSYGISGSVVNKIESGQAFFISGGSLGGNINITENSKTSGSNLVSKPSGNSYPALFTNIYSVAASGNRMVDGNFVAMDDGYSNLVDDYDGRKQSNFNENFAMLRDGVILAVEKRKPFTANDTVFYNMNQMRPNNYQIEFRPQQIDPSIIGILEDTYLSSKTAVDMNGNTTYNFSIDANAGSYAANRFRLVFGPRGAPLPVTFKFVKAAEKGNNIAVEWKVSNQLNLAGYEVEKSVDGRSFSKVAIQPVNGANNSEAVYNWLDVKAVKGSNFYRIKVIDISGAFRYSNIVIVVLGKINTAISISPNPVKGNIVNLQFTNQPAGVYSIRLNNTAGQLLYRNTEIHAGGSATLSFKLSKSATKGIYQLEIIAPDKTRQFQKLIIDAGN